MEYVKEGEKVNMLVEMTPLIETATGCIISWKIIRCFRLNPPKKEEKKEQVKLEVKKVGDVGL